MNNPEESKKKKLIDFKNKNTIYTIIFLVVVLIFFIVNNSGNGKEQGPYPPHYKPNSSAENSHVYDFKLTNTDGKLVSLADYKGKVLLINFWATWSGSCQDFVPKLVNLKSKYSNNDFEIIGISLDSDNPEHPRGDTRNKVIPFMKNFEVNYPIVYGDLDITNRFGGIRNIPASFILDKSGKIQKKFTGTNSIEDYENQIEKLL